MVFDADGVFHDGTTITADITPTSVTRSSGSAVLNLAKTPAAGLSVVLIMRADLAETSDTILITIEESATANGTYVEVARFPLLTRGTGMPGTYILRFQTDLSHVRAKIDITDADSGSDFSVANCFVLLSPYAFQKL